MIYLKNHNYTQRARIPKSFLHDEGPYQLELISTVNRTKIAMAVKDEQRHKLYYYFDIQLPDKTQPGEYEYRVKNNQGDILAEGLAVVVMEKAVVKAPKTKVKFKQYEGK